jgi:diguanylate cyclase
LIAEIASDLQSFLSKVEQAKLAKEWSVPVSAQRRITEETKGSRWKHARVSLVVPIGVIVAVAIVCVVVAVLTSAQRADQVSFNREQALIKEAIAHRGARVLQQLDSAVGKPHADANIRKAYDPPWVAEHIGHWLQAYFDHDVVVVVDGADQIEFTRFRVAADDSASPANLRAGLTPSLDLLRGRLRAVPGRTLDLKAGQNPQMPGSDTALVQDFLGRPAIVAAVAVGTDAELAAGNDNAPIVFSVKYVDDAMLRDIGHALQLANLHGLASAAAAGDSDVT